MTKQREPRQVEYVPPAQSEIHAFAQRICEQLAEDHDASFNTPEMIYGLAEFMRIAGRIQAKYLNRRQAVDNQGE